MFLAKLTPELARSPYSVCLVSNRAIRRYNDQFRHKNEATDVLSFPAHDAGSARLRTENGYLGDILISVEMAQANAAQYGMRLEDEIKALILHGLLHLLGEDHERDHGSMARSEKRWGARL